MSFYAIHPFRTGLDAHSSPPPPSVSWLWELPLALLVGAALASVFIVIGWWTAKLISRRWVFVATTAAVPATLFSIPKIISVLSWRSDPLRGRILPFEQSLPFYLPNYLEVAAMALAFVAGAFVFQLVSSRRR